MKERVSQFAIWLLAAVLLPAFGTVCMGAESKSFRVAGTTVGLEEASAEVKVFFSAMRFNRALGVWNVEVSVTNTGGRQISGPFVLLLENFTGTSGPIQADGLDDSVPAKPYYDLSGWVGKGKLGPGEGSERRTVTLGFIPGSAPSVSNRVFVLPDQSGFALAQARTLDSTGQPLPVVSVEENGPLGTRTKVSDAGFGIVTLGQAAGAHVWKFSKAGYVPVWRQAVLRTGDVAVVPAPRLTSRATNTELVSPIGGVIVSNTDGSVRLTFASGTLAQPGSVTITTLDGQALPASLPPGWSPLETFWAELSLAPALPISAELRLRDVLGQGETVALTKLNETTLQWDVVQLLAGNGSSAVSASLGSAGAYAVVIRDGGSGAPPAPVVGQSLQPSFLAAADSATLSAGGLVQPSSSPASRVAEEVTATGTVTFTNTNGPLPSGSLFLCNVSEAYSLKDGSRRQTPVYNHFISAYQRPGDNLPATLQADFALRPLLLFGPDELDQATLTVDVLPPEDFSGAVFDVNGGLASANGIQIVAGNGEMLGREAVQLRRIDTAAFAQFNTNGLAIVSGFELGLAGITPGRQLHLNALALPATNNFILAQVLYDHGLYGLQPVERFHTDDLHRLGSAEPTSGEKLPGINGSGQFLLLRADAAQGLVSGIARNSAGQPAAGAPVQITGQPWLTFADTNGHYSLLAPSGAVQVAVTDLLTGDAGFAITAVTNPGVAVVADLSTAPTAPQIVSVSPRNGAINVSRVTPIVINFSEPVNPATLLAGGAQLLGSNGVPVAASLTLNLRGTVATLLPTSQLDASTFFTILISTNVTDLTGLSLQGQAVFTFTTESDQLNRAAAQLIIYEPTNGLAPIYGTPGSAEPNSPVILVNETSGETATILSKADGSFTNFIAAETEDFISAVLVNHNGTRTTLPASRQIFRDGRVGLYQGGGILEAQSDGGPVQVFVEPGAIETKTVFKLDFLDLTQLLPLIGTNVPTGGTILGKGLQISANGGSTLGPVHISFPFSNEELAQAGITNGATPEESVFALVAPSQLKGDTVYMLLDKMQYENGNLVTHSPPFPGENLLLNPPTETQAALDVQGLTLSTAPSTAGGGHEAIHELAVIPLLLATRTQPVLFTGKVIEETLDANHQPVSARAVGGAVVTVTPRSLDLSGSVRPGHLAPGSIYCLSSPNGAYAAMLPEAEIQDPTTSTADSFQLTAQHPSRFGLIAITPASAQVATARLTDIIFRVPAAGSVTDPNPPRLSVFHTPGIPSPGAQAQITVLASHGSDLPDVEIPISRIQVQPLIPNGFIPANAVRVLPKVDTRLGATIVRSTFPVSCVTNALVTFEVHASANGARDGIAAYQILFTDSPPVTTNPPASNDNDRVGPRVVLSIPQDDPDQTAAALSPGQPITIIFDEAVDRGITNGVGVSLSPAAGQPVIQLSPDQRTMTLSYYALEANKNYTLTLNSNVKDISPAQNSLDQDPLNPGSDPFVLRFHTAPTQAGNLSDLISGGGVVMRGIFAFALERAGALDGAVTAYALSDPTRPVKVGELSVPGFPRDLALIPDYSFVTEIPLRRDHIRTNNLLAVVGGKLGGTPDEFGNLIGGFQYLWIIDISNPTNLTRVASANLSASPSLAVTKVQWKPPYLAYLESDADSQSISILNLQSFILGSYLAPQDFSLTPNDGFDANGDGDFVDEHDRLPIPLATSQIIAGKIGSFGLGDTDQRINDFFWDSSAFYLGVVVSAGHVLDLGGHPAGDIPAAYRTLFKQGVDLTRTNSSFEITTGAPKRLFALLGVPFKNSTGQQQIGDLALISIDPAQAGDASLLVLDVTDPTHPTRLTDIPIPQRHGLVQSIVMGEDGLLHLATSEDVLLLDPQKLTEAAPQNGAPHPALVGVIAGMGSGARSFGTDVSGLQVVNLGARHAVTQTAPLVRFVSFPKQIFGTNDSNLAFDPRMLTNRTQVQAVLDHAQPVDELQPACLRTNPGPSTLSPPDRLSHYYVLVNAPGSAGATLDLSLESLNDAQYPLANKGRGFLPVRAMSAKSLQAIDQSPATGIDSSVPRLTAYRLSNDPTQPAYNVYLSKPFALLACENPTPDEMRTLTNDLDRVVLWSGYFERAYLDYSQVADPVNGGGNPILGPFCGLPDNVQKVMRPGCMALAASTPGDYLTGPNPPSPVGHSTLPGSFGSVSAHNGEVRTDTVDFSLPSRRMPIVFKRTLGSQDLFDGPFGRGWDFNYNQRIISLDQFRAGTPCPVVLKGGVEDEVGNTRDALFVNGEGRVLVYKFAGTNAPLEYRNDPLVQSLGWFNKSSSYYLPPSGVFDMLVRFQDQKYARLLPDGTEFWYSPAGKLDAIYNRYTNNVQVMRYDERGELVRIEDLSVSVDRYLSIGHYRPKSEQTRLGPCDVTTLNPKEVGRICRLVDYTGTTASNGRDVLFFYNEKGELERREAVNVQLANPGGFTGRQKTYYHYLSSNQTPGQDYPRANGLSQIVAGDPNGAPLISVSQFLAGSPAPVAKKFEGANGPVTLDVQYGNTAAELAAGNGKVHVTTADNAESQMTLNKFSLPEESKLSGQGTQPAVTYTTKYTTNGLPSEIDYPMGNKVLFTYDFQLGQVNLRSQPNLRVKETVPHGGGGSLFERFAYDGRYNLKGLQQQDINGNQVNYTLSPDGLDVLQIDYPPVGINLPLGLPALPAGLGATEKFAYNSFGQLTRHQDINGFVTGFQYNRPDGFMSRSTSGESAGIPATSFTYAGLAGLLGHPQTVAPPLNASMNYTYNEREELLSQDRGGLVSTFSYDENGRVVRQTSTVDSGKTLEQLHLYEQNGFLRTNIVRFVETGINQTQQELKTTYDHDAAFRITRITLPNGETKVYDPSLIDHLGRPHQMQLGAYTETYDYDDNNNLISVGHGDATTTYQYDGFDRLTAVIVPAANSRTETTYHDYFNSGDPREVTVVDSQGKTNLHIQYQIDSLKRVAAATVDTDHGEATKIYSYDQSSLLHRIALPSGEVEGTQFDDAGRMLVSSNSVSSVQYSLDGNGNVLSESSHEGPSLANTYTRYFDPFDNLDRSTRLADDVGTNAVILRRRLDGKILQASDGRSETTVSDFTMLGEPTLRRTPSGVEFRTAYDLNRQPVFKGDGQNQGWGYVYDNSLRLTAHTLRDAETFTFSDFDTRNQPRTVTFPASGQLQIHQDYDPQGRLVSRSSQYLAHARSETNVFDALDRPSSISFSANLSGMLTAGSMGFEYDLQGPVRRVEMDLLNHSFEIRNELRQDGFRTNVSYPSTISLAQVRDTRGRLVQVQPSSGVPIIAGTDFEAADLVGRQVLGNSAITCENTFDLRKRLLERRYLKVAGGQTNVLSQIRYAYDGNNNVVARQFLDRGGRTEFFAYDADNRLVRADFGARPVISNASTRQVNQFAVPAEVAAQGGSWSAGFFGRNYRYDPQFDLRTNSSADNPDNFSLSPFASSLSGFDADLFPTAVDGVSRTRDSLGDATSTLLEVHFPGGAAPTQVEATLQYDGNHQLVRVIRADGVQIDYEYLPTGLCYYRKVSGPAGLCIPSEQIFIWDGARLIEEYDVNGAAANLRARYYYSSSDVPVAADVSVNGTLKRVYYLVDIQGSPVGLADEQGQVLERYGYDAWGQPSIELADTRSPVIRRVISETNGFEIEFSERILPRLIAGGSASLAANYVNLTSGLTVQQSGVTVPGTMAYEESATGSAFGTVIRFVSVAPISGTVVLQIQQAAVNDEWNNPINATNISLTLGSPPGTVLFQDLSSTASSLVGRTFADQPFLFHGQYFDFDSGLSYMRARFYDPFTGLFLQPDPAGYEQSVNPYAAFGHNPQSGRDPSGGFWHIVAGAAIGAAIGAAVEAFHERHDAHFDAKKIGAAALGGAIAGGVGAATMGGSIAIGSASIGTGFIGMVGGSVLGGMATRGVLGQHAISASDVATDAASAALGGVVVGGAMKVGSAALRPLLKTSLGAARSLAGRLTGFARKSGVTEEGLRFEQQMRIHFDDLGPGRDSVVGNFFAYFNAKPGTFSQQRFPADMTGYKLHISARPEDAVEVAKAVLPILKEYGVEHKIVLDLARYEAQLQGNQAGKLVTAYTRTPEEFYYLVRDLDRALLPLRNSDVPIKSGPTPKVRFPAAYDVKGRPIPKSGYVYPFAEDVFGESGFISGRYGPYNE